MAVATPVVIKVSHLLVMAMLCGCSVWMTAGMKCLQCFDTQAGGPCRHDYKVHVNTSLGIFPNGSRPYYKPCPDGSQAGVPAQNKCVIEEIYVGGALKSFIRDCSDGKIFSFTGIVNGNPKLDNIASNNYTTCAYLIPSNAHVCVTLCEGDDFCNAPRPPPQSNETECDYDDPYYNSTCGAAALRATSGPFGPMVDRLFGGHAPFLPFLAAILCAMAFV